MATRGTRKTPTGPTKVEVTRHNDKRTNIPTDELRSFVADDEKQPTRLVYERDTSLDPQLVWRGKDQQDVDGLEVPAVPIYIQEKIHPRVLIENLRRTAEHPEDEPELALFNDFNGIEFEELVDFYEHEQNWTNRLILGDSLLVMASLAEKENLRGKVQTIFIDPPYGINFGSNWQVSTQNRDVRDGKLEHVTRQPEQIRAFRDTWQDGIHSYLTYLRDRLAVSRDLLAETGHVFVQIGDENVHLVRSLLDETFGAENFVSLITFRKTSSATGDFLGGVTDYLLWYAKDRSQAKYRQIYRVKAVGADGAADYRFVELPDGERRPMSVEERRDSTILPAGARLYRLDNLTSQSAGRQKGEGAASWFKVHLDDRDFTPGNARWKTNEEGMERLLLANRVATRSNSLSYVRFLDDFPAYPINNSWDDTVVAGSWGDDKVYVVQTSTKVIERCMLMTSDPGDLVLDPTNGSGSTAVVAEEWGRRWISVDTSRVAVALTRTRMAALRLPYYLLNDSAEGQAKEEKLAGRPGLPGPYAGDIRKGFVYERIPHVMLRDIAKNPDIKPRMSRDEINAAIVRHSEHELLFNRPYDDKRVVRVCGPFTVESLSPHRIISEDEQPETEEVPDSSASFEETILGNLVKAGVQNQDRNQRLLFDSLEPYAGGQWVHARGMFTDDDGQTRTVGISLRVRDRPFRPGPRGGEGGGQGRRLRSAARVRLRARRAHRRGREGVQAGDERRWWRLGGDRAGAVVRSPTGDACPDEPGPVHGRGAPEEDRRREPVHRLRRARHRDRPHGRRPSRGRGPRR